VLDLGFFGWIFVGLLAGAISGALVGGRTARGCLPNIVVGIIGGVVGGWLAQQMGFAPISGLITAIVAATLGSIIVRLILNALDRDR
jgi:uncharacterized membrane protein YeaQ/YmgE (transglycosylase-associated protein family)